MCKKIKLIRQSNNLNSYSDLYIVDNKVYKIYHDNKISLVKYNLENVKELIKNKYLRKYIPNVVFPDSLLYRENEVIGFSMPYVRGNNLYEFMDNSNAHEIEEVLNKIYNTMTISNKLSINICDFHKDNVIIDKNNNPYLIDCDSFIINGNNYNNGHNSYLGKYISYLVESCNDIYFDKHSIKSDYFCLFMTLLDYIENDRDRINDLFKGYYVTNNSSINRLVSIDNINNFNLRENDLKIIIKSIKNIEYKEKYFVSNEELSKKIDKVRKLYKL